MGRSINKLRNKKGFTLIELIVVLAVLAIIMAIAVPRFTGVREQAKIDADYATLESIAKLEEMEYVRGVVEDDALDQEKVSQLIKANFGESGDEPKKIFQSSELTNKESNLDILFTDGFVSAIKIGENTVYPKD